MGMTNEMKRALLAGAASNALVEWAIFNGVPLPDGSNQIGEAIPISLEPAEDSEDEYLTNTAPWIFQAGDDPATATHIAALAYSEDLNKMVPGWWSPIADKDGNPRTIELQPHDEVTFGIGAIVVRLSEIGRQILD